MQGAIYLYSAAAVILALEIIAGRHKNIYRKDDVLIVIGCQLVSFVTRPAAALLVAASIGLISDTYANTLYGTSIWLAFPILLAITEFAFYWVHRWAHEAKVWSWDVLWKLHRTHHSAPFMNVGLFVRMHPLWYFVAPQGMVLGLATYLGLGQAAALVLATYFGWNLVTHSNFRWDDSIRRMPVIGTIFYALEHVIVSPGIHHTHHGYGKDGGNYRNFATVLSIWDWVFGTLHIPAGRPQKYGIPGGGRATWSEQVFYPVVISGERRPNDRER